MVPSRTALRSKLTKAHAAALHTLSTGSTSSASMPDKLTRLNAINVATYLANTAVTYGSQVPTEAEAQTQAQAHAQAEA